MSGPVAQILAPSEKESTIAAAPEATGRARWGSDCQTTRCGAASAGAACGGRVARADLALPDMGCPTVPARQPHDKVPGSWSMAKKMLAQRPFSLDYSGLNRPRREYSEYEISEIRRRRDFERSPATGDKHRCAEQQNKLQS